MSVVKPLLIPVVATILVLLLAAAGYVVVPPCEANDVGWGCETEASLAKGWIAEPTNVTTSEAGDLHVDLTILNETGDWSAMQAVPQKPALLKSADGAVTNCDTVFVGTGGHYLAPGFQMRGYTTGSAAEPQTQMIYVECKGASSGAGAVLNLDVSYVTGQYNYYDKIAGETDVRLEVDLDKVPGELSYPIVTPVDGLVRPSSEAIIGLNEVALSLAEAVRTDKGLELKWQAFNPSDYPSALHVGPPPVIGSDGILYGLYQDPGSVSAPLTSPGKTTDWSIAVDVPQDVRGLYLMVSVETGTRLFTNHVIDITDK